MRRKAALGHIIHSLGPDLHLDETALPVLYCYMQGLIAVRLRVGDPVAEALCVGFVLFGHI